MSKGSSVQVPIVVTPIAGFSGSVAFGCTPPANTETLCSVTPTEITAGAGTVSLLLTTTSAHAQATQQALNRGGRAGGGSGGIVATSLALAGMVMLLMPGTRRRLPVVWVLLLATGMAVAMTGCGNGPTTTAGKNGSGGTTPSDPGTPQGTLTFVITAVGTDGLTSVSHQMTYLVTVQ